VEPIVSPLAPGLYYTSKNNTIINGLEGDGVTIVTEGKIHMNGTIDINASGNTWDSSGLSIFSNHNASDFDPVMYPNPLDAPCPSSIDDAIVWSSSSATWGGIQYAPHGAVNMSAAASDSSFNGSIIAYDVKLAGSSIKVVAHTDPDNTQLSRLELSK
jgi:hypothetical protein